MRPSNFLVSHTWYTIWISFARKFQLLLTFSDALHICDMVWYMQFYIAGLGCGFGVTQLHFLHVESIIALHITFPRYIIM